MIRTDFQGNPPLAKARKSKSIVVWFLTINVLILVAVVGVQYYRAGTFSALVVIPIGFASIIVGEFSKLSKMSKELKRRAAEQ